MISDFFDDNFNSIVINSIVDIVFIYKKVVFFVFQIDKIKVIFMGMKNFFESNFMFFFNF